MQSAPGNASRCYAFRIQPSDSTMFPWLCQIADRFDKYRVTSLAFTYTSTRGTNTPGVVAMAIDYDPHDSAPTSPDQDGRQQIMSHVDAQQHPLWEPFCMAVPGARLLKAGERWIRNWSGESQVESRTADLGVLYLGIFGTEAGDPIETPSQWVGDLSVSYTIELMMPQMNPPEESSGPQVIDVTEIYSSSATHATPQDSSSRDALSGDDPLTPLGEGQIPATTRIMDQGPALLEYGTLDVDGLGGVVGVLEVKDDFEGVIEVELHTLPHVPADFLDAPFDVVSWKQVGPEYQNGPAPWYEPTYLSDVHHAGTEQSRGQDLLTPSMTAEDIETYTVSGLELFAHVKKYVWQCVGTWLKGQFLSLMNQGITAASNYVSARIRAAPRSLIPEGVELRRNALCSQHFMSPRRAALLHQTIKSGVLTPSRNGSRVRILGDAPNLVPQNPQTKGSRLEEGSSESFPRTQITPPRRPYL